MIAGFNPYAHLKIVVGRVQCSEVEHKLRPSRQPLSGLLKAAAMTTMM